ncbi:hypothetical protein D3C76_1856190 [compost metagenome]
MVLFSVAASVGSLTLIRILLKMSCKSVGCEARTKPAAANDTIIIGIIDRNEK